jgi:hypothetical protein
MEVTAEPGPGKRNRGKAAGKRREQARAARKAAATGAAAAPAQATPAQATPANATPANATPANAGAKATGPAAKPQNSAARIIGQTIWEYDFDSSNPSATAAERKQGWAAARARYIRLGKQVQARLLRRGLLIGPAGDAAKE